MRRMYPLLVAAVLTLLLAGCGASNSNSGASDVPITAPESPAATSQPVTPTAVNSNEPSPSSTGALPSDNKSPEPNDQEAQLKKSAQEVVEYLRERDLKSLVSWIDPELGLRFSPYPYINIKSDLVFKPDEVPSFKDSTVLTWGSYDGSGDAIELSFRDYFEKFVYNQDFADAPEVNVNRIQGTGNVEFNGKEVYPNASYVEFHFPGFDKKYDGQDWQSLVLVFVPSGSEWKLCAVVHGQWTI